MLQSSELLSNKIFSNVSFYLDPGGKEKKTLKESYSFYFFARLAKMSIMSLVKLIALLLNFKKGG